MSEKKVYAMATDGCLDYVTAGKVYLTRPFYQSGDDSEDMEYFDPDFDAPWAFSTWKCSTHLNGGDWVRLELTEEEAEAINARLQERPEEAACDSDIEWSPWIRHDYMVDSLAEIASVTCMIRVSDGSEYGSHGEINGRDWDWSHVTHYRIPMEDYRRIHGYLAEALEEASKNVGESVKRAVQKVARASRDPLESHPNSELDADQYTVGGDTVNMPSHYTSGEIECIDAIQAQMTPEQFVGYLRGNLVKYVWRYEHKGGVESLRKAEWYLRRLIDVVE